jgi:hypothetical protein
MSDEATPGAPSMDDERWTPGMPVLDRQAVAPAQRDVQGRPLVPSRVPEAKPTPLQPWFIYLSIVGLVCGTIAITALNLGATIEDASVRLPVLLGGLMLVLVTVDAALRIWRSAFAWLPVDRGRGLFRFVWFGVACLGIALELGAMLLVVAA